MRKYRSLSFAILLTTSLFFSSCEKEISQKQQQQEQLTSAVGNLNAETPPFNLEVTLHGEDNGFGLVKFRQDVDPAKIIILDTWVRDLEPDHEYQLQRAVDPINVVDGDCTSISWLTLGKGLTAQSIITDAKGTGNEQLWRDVTAVPTGSKFDIHFRIVDASNMAVVLTSNCYEYTVR